MSASRNLPLFIVSSLRDIDRYYDYFKLPTDLDRSRKILITTFTLCIASIAGYYLYVSYLPWTSRYVSYPAPEVAYLQTHSCSGNLFNDYTYGGYIIWQLPHTSVYIDGRMPTWHSPSGQTYIDEYFAVLHKPAAQAAAFRRYHIHCALLSDAPRDKRLRKSLRAHGWVVAASGNRAVLLVAPKK
jgi:hypothetical protein